MSIAYKDVIRFVIPREPRTLLEVTDVPLQDEWEANVRLRRDAPSWELLGRRFRGSAKGEALGKMVRWVRGRFPEAMPLLERQERSH